jgi:hypothetical protein
MNRLALTLAVALASGCEASVSASDESWGAAPPRCPSGQGQCHAARDVSLALVVVADAGPDSSIDDGAAGAAPE